MFNRLRRVYHGSPHLARTLVAPLLRFSDPLSAMHWELGIPSDYVQRGLPRHETAADLAPCDGHFMTPATRDHWQRMRDDAARDRVVLCLNWAFRSVTDQALLIRDAIRSGESIQIILERIAAPGYSEHHTGRALDIGSDSCSGPGFECTHAYDWLCTHAGEYGFVQTYPRGNHYGIMFEPWHWCWHPSNHEPPA
jgi:D-alanyl-D-alanine carboxypeptidase